MHRENKTSSRRSPEQPAAVWREQETLDGKLVDAGVIILRTSGCSHYHKGGCTMCGYNFESDKSVKPANIIKQFDSAMEDLGDIRFLKLYTSGSFLDECEIPKDVAQHILKTTADKGLRLLFESRPEFVTHTLLQDALAENEELEIALGLESSNDRVLKYSINKGFTRADYENAARSIVAAGIDVRTYVLLKPPFLTEAEAIADSKETIRYASEFSKVVSLNPVNVQKGTHVERLWRNWAYRPPWLWSVLDVLKAPRSEGIRLVCEPTGGGKERGAHNCGKCDDTILASIKAFSQNQDPGRLGAPECECKDMWQSVLELDGFAIGGTADLQRFFRKQRN
jgi:radical SAM enzyme (TIGR01210 family)